MPIRAKNPVAGATAPVVVTPRARVRSVQATPGMVFRKVLTSTTIVEVEPGVRGCASALSTRIKGHPELHIQLRLPDGAPMKMEVVKRDTGELVDVFAHWGALEAKYGAVTPASRWKEEGHK